MVLLAKLKADGILTDEQFENAKEAMLAKNASSYPGNSVVL